MKFDLSKIEYSNNDLRRKIKLPSKTTEELAEFIGILTGDGHLAFRSGKGYKHYEIRISGHWIDDQRYFNEIVNKIFKNLFNIKLLIKHRKDQGYTLLAYRDSKSIVNFLHKLNNLYLGNKSKKLKKIIPWINLSKKYKSAFLRGLADTDFSLCFKRKYKQHHHYPVIKIEFKNKFLVNIVSKILTELGFKYHLKYNNKWYDKRIQKYKIFHYIDINGKNQLKMWIKLIGFNNPKHFTKYQIWKKFGFCPPKTTIIERQKILKGEIDPYIYYGSIAKRQCTCLQSRGSGFNSRWALFLK